MGRPTGSWWVNATREELNSGARELSAAWGNGEPGPYHHSKGSAVHQGTVVMGPWPWQRLGKGDEAKGEEG
jgi:hypothetical protein